MNTTEQKVATLSILEHVNMEHQGRMPDDNGVLMEDVTPMFLADIANIRKTYLYRMSVNGKRFYYRLVEDGANPEGMPKVKFYPSVTQLIRHTTPTPIGLLKWYAQHGMDKAHEIRDEKAHYGTMMHILIAQFLIRRELDLGSIAFIVENFLRDNNLPYDPVKWKTELTKDVTAFAQFVFDRDVIPIAMEIALYSDTLNTAGMADLVCTMTFNKKRVLAMVDYKSGRKGFYESHAIQLGIYRAMWNELYADIEDMQVTEVFNWSPTDWRKAPNYNLERQTENTAIQKIPHLVELYKVDGSFVPSDVVRPVGVIMRGVEPKASCLKVIKAEEYALMRVLHDRAPFEEDNGA